MRTMRLVCLLVLVAGTSTNAVTNVFNQVYSGFANDYTGRLGYSFTAKRDFLIDAMGCAVTGGTLHAAHVIQLYDVSTAALVASVTVNNASTRDSFGYAFASVGASPIAIQSGREYMILQSATLGDGDLWFGGAMPNYKTYYVSVNGGEATNSGTGGGIPPVSHVSGVDHGWGPPSFYIVDPQANSAAWSPSPPNGATNLTPYVSLWVGGAFMWEGPLAPQNVTPDQVRYNVYFGSDPDNLPLVSANQSSKLWWPNYILNLGPTTYYWRIDALDGGTVLDGHVWSFSTQACPSQTGDVGGPQDKPDCRVNIYDLAVFASKWLSESLPE